VRPLRSGMQRQEDLDIERERERNTGLHLSVGAVDLDS
jgi:hypothetical protein